MHTSAFIHSSFWCWHEVWSQTPFLIWMRDLGTFFGGGLSFLTLQCKLTIILWSHKLASHLCKTYQPPNLEDVTLSTSKQAYNPPSAIFVFKRKTIHDYFLWSFLAGTMQAYFKLWSLLHFLSAYIFLSKRGWKPTVSKIYLVDGIHEPLLIFSRQVVASGYGRKRSTLPWCQVL